MTLDGLTWIIVGNGVVQLVGLVILIRGQRDMVRTVRAVAGLVYQEEQKTRLPVRDPLSRDR